jgi:hypothetical protein
VFAVGHPLLAPLGRETAALLACSTPAVLSHLTAARLWDLPAPESEEIHVTVDRRHATKRAGIRSHRVRWLAHDDVCRHYRLPLTTVRRTLLDLAEHLSLRDLERATDQALGRRLVSRAALGRALELAPGRRGIARLRAMLQREAGPALTRSEAEARFLSLVRAGGLPDPQTKNGWAAMRSISSGSRTASLSRSTGSRSTRRALRSSAIVAAMRNCMLDFASWG